MKKLLKYFNGYKKEAVLAPVFKALEAAFELMIPMVVASIIDVGIGNGDKAYIVGRALLMVGLGLVGLCSTLAAQYFSAKAACGFAAKLRDALFSHIQGLSYTELDTVGTSKLLTGITSDVNTVQNGVNMTLRLLSRSPFIVFGAMIAAFMIDVKSALVFAVAIPLLLLAVFAIMLVSIPLYKKVRAKLDRVLGLTSENLSGARVIRAFCKEDDMLRRFEDENDLLTGAQKLVGRVSALLNPLTYVIINVAISALIYTGAIRVESGVITQGALVALYNYMSQILIELIKLANLIITITKAVACGNRIESMLEIENSMKNGSLDKIDDAEYAVRFCDASLKYKSSAEESLTDIDFDVKPGQSVGIIGGTGSGKSSLVNMIARFYDTDSGSVMFFGHDVRDYDIDFLRSQIGIVPQKAVLFRGSIRDNMKKGNQNATDEEIMSALETAQAADFVKEKPGVLDFEVEQGGKNFSGGQKQRLTIARAIVRKPKVLILDDSASALDFATDAALRHAISCLSWKPTLFIVSQRASSVMHADKIVVLDDGVAVGVGTHDELLRDCSVYKEIYGSQFESGKEAAV